MFKIENNVLLKYKEENVVVIITKGVNEIEDNAFYFSNVEKIYIPKSIIRIGDYAFYPGETLKDVYYEGSIDDLNKIYIGDWNESFFSTNFYCNVNMNLDTESKNVPVIRIELSNFPINYEEVLKYDNYKLYEISGELSEISCNEEYMDVMFKNYDKVLHIVFYDNQMLDNIVLCLGSTINLVGSVCYEVGQDMIVFLAKEVKKW